MIIRNNKIILHLLIISLITFSSCVFDKTDGKLKIYNDKSDKYFYRLKKDTTLVLSDVNYITEELQFATVNIGDTSVPTFAFTHEGGYKGKINKECLDSTLFIYFFRVDSVKKYNWDLIVKNNDMYSVVGFKIKDLDSIKWVIKIGDYLK